MPAFHVHVEDPAGRHTIRIDAGSPTDARLRARAPDRIVLKVKIARADETPRGARLTRKALLRQTSPQEISR
ncbi:hypothetical protein Sa4125_25400 [Aureimonas sp. SA4125]|nr:hypothetical protein Sa4125_25400 [Aureimonas sp. SA4125]